CGKVRNMLACHRLTIPRGTVGYCVAGQNGSRAAGRWAMMLRSSSVNGCLHSEGQPSGPLGRMRPFQITNLWDMLRYRAEVFVRLIGLLDKQVLHRDWVRMNLDRFQESYASNPRIVELVERNEVAFYEAMMELKETLKSLETTCTELEMT